MDFIADIFGYLLNFIYEFVNNYGLAIIIFSIILKILLLPISISQQKTLKKSQKMQEKTREIQEKYKGNQEKINTEMIELYKREKMNPFSGCFSSIIQLVLLISIFLIVSKPLTHMKKVDSELIQQYTDEIKTQYQEENKNLNYTEIAIIKEKGYTDDRVYLNMNFLGLDLNSVPMQEYTNWKVYVIPGLYIISSFISIRITSNMNNKKKKKEENREKNELDAIEQANKNMMWLMPLMSVTIAIIAPLGLALYWLVNNILVMIERLVINHFIGKKEEDEQE